MDLKQLFCAFTLILGAGAPAAADSADFLKKRLFFNGYVEGTLQPPRNEIDANLRRPDLPETGGYGYAFARYSIRGQLFLGLRVDLGPLKNIFITIKPDLLFGNNVPQRSYTWSASPIGYVRNIGVGVSLPGSVKVFLESHRWNFVGVHDLAVPGDGPKGLHHSIVIRKEFRFGHDQ